MDSFKVSNGAFQLLQNTIVCRPSVFIRLIIFSMESSPISLILKKLRADAGLSQEDLAAKAGLHRTYVSQLERGLKSPTLKTIEKMAKVFKISMSELVSKIEKKI